MPKVTIIMPSFNVAKYIRPCMESVLAQTLQDIEILAIDAGSTDGTEEILQEYASIDNRVKVVNSDKKSYGYQLNVGISLAKGEYVGVVETDDLVALDMFEILYEKAKEVKADYVKGAAQTFMNVTPEITVTSQILCVSNVQQMDVLISPSKHPELFITDRFLWMGIYRSDFIKKIKLNETPGAAFQDIGFMFQVIQNADSAIYLNKNVYYYRQDNGNASSYDAKAFQYLEAEYTYIRQFLEKRDIKWYQVYYEKMLNQCLGRFRVMGMQGVFWNDYYSEILTLQSWLKEAVQRELLQEKTVGKERWQTLHCFLENPELVYKEYAQSYREKVKYISNLFDMIGNGRIIIFGSGRYGKFFHALLENKHPGHSVAVCDNNSELWDTRVQGLTVLSPDKAVSQFPDAVYVIANLKNVDIMKDQLKMLGIVNEKICVYQEAPDMLLFHIRGI